VWISNQFGNTGVDFTRIGATFNTANKIPFVIDPANQPKTVTGATAGSFSNEIDFIDPDFEYPSVYRANLAIDRKLPWGLYATLEGVGSKTISDIKYQNYNYTNSVTLVGVGGRPFYIKRYSTLSDGILLTNTHQGYNWTGSLEVRRPFESLATGCVAIARWSSEPGSDHGGCGQASDAGRSVGRDHQAGRSGTPLLGLLRAAISVCRRRRAVRRRVPGRPASGRGRTPTR
jgi:hypothetical protein